MQKARVDQREGITMQMIEGEPLITAEEIREMFNSRRGKGERMKRWLHDRLYHLTSRHFGTLIEAREAQEIARICGIGSCVQNCFCGRWILRLGSKNGAPDAS